ncbi:tetratricopeptide repeat protein [Porphyromonadaceae bacterium W3.11]|nr:tetratricopeptide repeat protein [Porphyromonadaceae bacterium W3.11]
MNKKIIVIAGLLLGGSLLPSTAQEISPNQQKIFIAKEALHLQSPVGVLEALAPIHKDHWKLTDQNEEARYLDALAKSILNSGDAELKLLHFIEGHPHSAYIHHAMSRMGELYYIRGQYGSASYWFKQVDSELLPEEMAIANDYYHAYSLMAEKRYEDAIRIFKPLTYAPQFRDDAAFYTGYLMMKEGQIDEAELYLKKVNNHRLYGPYAKAYLAEAQLSKMKYSEALQNAVDALNTHNLPQEVKVSLFRTAGLASANLGQVHASTDFLENYMKLSNTPGRIEQLTLGKNLFELGRHRESISYLQNVSNGEKDFMSQLSLYYMGLGYLSMKQPQQAIISFDQAKAIAYHPPVTEAAAYNGALAAYAQTPGKVGAGSQRMSSFLSEFPRSEYRNKVINYLSDAFLNEPNSDVAISEMNKFSPLPKELVKTRERVRLKQANRALNSGKTASATKQYDDIIRTAGDAASVAEAHLWKGEAAYRSGDFKTAINSTESYLRTRPSELELNPNAYYTLGYAYYNLRQYDNAERNFHEYIRLKPTPTPDEKSAVNNRLGDIQMQRKSYESAMNYYQKSELAGGAETDFAIFNQGMIKGLQRDYQGKSTILGNLINRYPNSKLVPEAMYEQGRSLALMGNNSGARNVFERFFNQYSRDKVAPKVGIQWALSYFNEGNLDEAAKVYERVIRDYPRTPEAKSAVQDLKSISVQLNRVKEFNDLISSTGTSSAISRTEMDSLSFLAAERVVSEGSSEKANQALDEYLQQYPNGAFVNNAQYNKALLQYNDGNYREATAIIQPLAPRFKGKLAIDSYRLLASSYDRLKETGRAAEAYLNLATLTTNSKDRSNWVIAAADRAFKSNSQQFIYGMAGDVANGSMDVNDEAKSMVFAYAADLYARNNQKSTALAYAQKVLSLPDYGKHTMANTIIGLDLMDQGKYKEVQNLMGKVTQKGSTDGYWLARAFILLADSYNKQGDKETAKAYLESVKGSYKNSSDGILDLVNERLSKL